MKVVGNQQRGLDDKYCYFEAPLRRPLLRWSEWSKRSWNLPRSWRCSLVDAWELECQCADARAAAWRRSWNRIFGTIDVAMVQSLACCATPTSSSFSTASPRTSRSRSTPTAATTPATPRRSTVDCERAAAAGHVIRSVRAVFQEGEPIFEASKIGSQSHVQIAVRDLTAILEIEEVAW
jgi:hypothetical protein